MNHSYPPLKSSPLFWPVLLSLLAHGVFVLCWHPRTDVTLTPPQPVQVAFRPAGTPQGDNRPVGGQPSAKPRPENQSKPAAAPERKRLAAAHKPALPPTESKPVAAKPALTRPETAPPAGSPSSVRPGSSASGAAAAGGGAAQGKGDTATGNGKGEGGGPGNGPKGDAPPGRAYTPAPNYPDTSIDMAEAGSVRLSMTISRDGSVRNAHVAGSSGFPRLDKAALRAVERWRFKPALKNGEPVEMPYGVTVRFNLNGSVTTAGG